MLWAVKEKAKPGGRLTANTKIPRRMRRPKASPRPHVPLHRPGREREIFVRALPGLVLLW